MFHVEQLERSPELLSNTEILKNIIEQKWIENRDRKNLNFILPEEITNLPEEIIYEVPQI